jgi:hypothetical protein
MSEVLVAKNAFVATVGGRIRSVPKGYIAQPGDPVLIGRRRFFKVVQSRGVEQATAAPGEQRETEFTPPPAPPKPKPERSRTQQDYSGLRQPELKALLEDRNIAYPNGVVSNAKLIELLTGNQG